MSVQNQNVAITVAACLFALGNPYKSLKLLFGPFVLIVSYCIVCNLTSATENPYHCPCFQGGIKALEVKQVTQGSISEFLLRQHEARCEL